MIRRVLSGAFVGLVIGAAIAGLLVAGFKVTTFDGVRGAFLAYGSAVIAGTLVGLVAGKPVWKAGIEGGLKAAFGAPAAAACMFALRRWGEGWSIDLHSLGAGGPAGAGTLPAVTIPLAALVLGALFGLDNTTEPGDKPGAVSASAKQEAARSDIRVEESSVDDQDESADSPAKRSRR